MEYKIFINKEAKPVLVEAHEPADTQNHISFKHPHLETKDILWELFRTKTKFAHLQELVGQTFDLPANVKVSFEYRYMGQSCFDGETYKATPMSLVGKLAVLSTEPAASEVQQGGEGKRSFKKVDSVTIGEIERVLSKREGLRITQITIISNEWIKEGNPIMMMHPNDYEEYEKTLKK